MQNKRLNIQKRKELNIIFTIRKITCKFSQLSNMQATTPKRWDYLSKNYLKQNITCKIKIALYW